MLRKPDWSGPTVASDAEDERQRIVQSQAFLGTVSSQDRRDHLAHAIRHVVVEGLWVEFGVSTGASLNFITSQTDHPVYGFDWFQGLPEDWVIGDDYETVIKGAFRGRPSFERPNMVLVDGLFQDTLPAFLEDHAEPVAFLHVDCDVYSSASYVLQTLRERFVVGTVIAFDELFNYPNYADHEMKALFELVATTGCEYVYLGHVSTKTAASLQITRVPAKK